MYLTNYSWQQCSDEAWCFQTRQLSEPKMLCHHLPESLSLSQILGTSASQASRVRAHHCPKTGTCSYHDPTIKSTKISVRASAQPCQLSQKTNEQANKTNKLQTSQNFSEFFKSMIYAVRPLYLSFRMKPERIEKGYS